MTVRRNMFINIELELEKVSCVTIVFDVLKYIIKKENI